MPGRGHPNPPHRSVVAGPRTWTLWMSLPTEGPEEAGGAWGPRPAPGLHSGGQAVGPARPVALGPVSPCPGFLKRNLRGPLGVHAPPARVAGGCSSGRLHEFTRSSSWARRGPPCLQVKVTQLCLTLCNPMDCSLPGASVHGILQARILEWVAIPFSRGSSQPGDRSQVSRIAGGFFTI